MACLLRVISGKMGNVPSGPVHYYGLVVLSSYLSGKRQIMLAQVEGRVHPENSRPHHFFTSFARKVAAGTGTPVAFLTALLIITIWAVTGPIFHFSDTWQLVINTGTTIVTFLMVFLIQNTQNRDAKATQLKLDELIVAIKEARNQMLDIESLSDEELAQLELPYHKLRAECDPQE